ncbi:hypothetical protein [Deinococcus fonticola]|nr:hypothetical protein [Deinococcus fonticola]
MKVSPFKNNVGSSISQDTPRMIRRCSFRKRGQKRHASEVNNSV